MAKSIHHVGIAVHDIDKSAEFFEKLLGAEMLQYKHETAHYSSRMMRMGEGLFELLQPRGDNSMITRFLNKSGEGVHHISMAVRDIDQVMAHCKENDIQVVMDRFIHPSSAHGVLIELVPDPDSDTDAEELLEQTQ